MAPHLRSLPSSYTLCGSPCFFLRAASESPRPWSCRRAELRKSLGPLLEMPPQGQGLCPVHSYSLGLEGNPVPSAGSVRVC